MKGIINIIISVIFSGIAGILRTFTQNNIVTSMYLEGLKSGNNSVAEYVGKLPNIVSVVCIVIAIIFMVRAVKIIIVEKK
jgi:hypothetical protein